MKKLLLATAAALCLATPASAFSNNNSVSLHTGNVELVCHPVERHDPYDRNPVQEATINMQLEDSTHDWKTRYLTIQYLLADGSWVNRDQQYMNGYVYKDAGKAQWYWTGTSRNTPGLVMHGSVWKHHEDGWRYREWLDRPGHATQMLDLLDCSENNG